MNDSRARLFIQQYTGLLEALSQVNPTRLFWATDFASKNRFSCPLPDLLERRAEGGQSGITGPAIRDRRVARVAGAFGHVAALALRSFQARHLAKRIDATRRFRVIRTFVYDHSFAEDGEYRDVFLGPLPQQVATTGSVLILASVLGDYRRCVAQMSRAKMPMAPVEAFLTVGDLVRALWAFLRVPLRIPSPLRFFGGDVSGLVRRYFRLSFKGVQFRQFVQFWAIRNLARRLSIDTFYMTYENYPWERMTISALRQESPDTKVVGIQHTVVPLAFLNYFVSEAEMAAGLVPDVIYTTGERTRDIISRYSPARSVPVRAGGALRFASLRERPIASRQPLRHVLLSLEGSLKAVPMVRRVLAELRGHDEYQLRVRTHPLVPWRRFQRHLERGADRQVSVSAGSLLDDVSWADIVVYRSTTVAVEALMVGTPVVHCDQGGILSLDPLFECPGLKWTADDEHSLAEVLHTVSQLPDEDFAARRDQSRQYLEQYFGPVTRQIADCR